MDDLVSRFREDCKSSRGRIIEIAAATGIRLKTLRNLRYRETASMHYEHMRKLAAYYELQGERVSA